MAVNLMIGRQNGGFKGGELLLTSLLALWVLGISLWPLGKLFLEAFSPSKDGALLGLMGEVLTARSTNRAFWNTLSAAGGSVLISMALGVTLALLTGLLQLRGRVLMTFLILSPVLIPSQTMALAWIELSSKATALLPTLSSSSRNPIYSGGGIALLMGIEHMPLVYIATRAALMNLPADLIEAARISGAKPRQTLANIILPLAAPAAISGGILAFAAAIGNFGVPALLGIPGRFPMLTTQIYQRLNGFGPSVAGQVAVLALILVVLCVVALALRSLLLRRLSAPLASGAPFKPFCAGRWTLVTEASVWLILGIIAILPMLALLATALAPALGVPLSLETITLRNFEQVLSSPAMQRAIANSLMLSVACAAICALVSLPFVFLAAVRKSRSIRLLDWLIDAPWVVPGTVVALAMILAFLRPLPLVGSLYGSFAILLAAYLARFLPLILRPVLSAAASLEPALDEAARIAGAGLSKRIFAILTPSVLPALSAGALMMMMTAINELTLSALLWSSGHETIGVMIFALQYEGNSTSAAAAAIVSLLMVFAMVWLLDRFAKHFPAGTLPWRA